MIEIIILDRPLKYRLGDHTVNSSDDFAATSVLMPLEFSSCLLSVEGIDVTT